MSREGIHQDDQVIGIACVLNVRVLAVTGGFLGSLQQLVYLVEIEIAEQGGEHAALRNAFLPGRLQHPLEQVEHRGIADPCSHLRQKQDRPHVVEVSPQVDVHDACLALDESLSAPLDRSLSFPLGPVTKRARLEVSLEAWFQDKLE